MIKPKYDFQFTERDGHIIAAVARYRFLTTSHIQRLVFRENTSPQSARRRLRYLRQGAFLRQIQPPLTGSGKEEAVYLLDKAGYAYALNMGYEMPKYGKFRETSLPFLSHALALSEFRLSLELALENHPAAQLHRFVSDFELKAGQRGLRGQHRFKLFSTLDDPITGESHAFYPDSVVILSGKGERSKSKRLYFVEIDKGTETLKVIERKLRAYELAAQSNLVTKFGAGERFRLLLQVQGEPRRQHILQAFGGHNLAKDVWVTDADQVTPHSVLHDRIWNGLDGEEHAIVKLQELQN